MSILIPWIAVFLVCLGLSLIGMRLQRLEKKRRQEISELRARIKNPLGSALSGTELSVQQRRSVQQRQRGINRPREQQGASGQFN